MRKAFTLIELLVVIAIIAILAGILFPVFAQAKVAAKKTAALSNSKQLGLGILVYTTDHDDVYPRSDGCVAGSSLNSAHNSNPFNPTGAGCFGPYYYRTNHFSWQKWTMPYIKNVQIHEHPMRQKDSTEWTNNGQIKNGFVLNTAITGSLDTYYRNPATFTRAERNSWLGGTTTSIPNPSMAVILLEFPTGTSVLPGGTVDSQGTAWAMNVYPVAHREFWRYKLMDGAAADCIAGTKGTKPDSSKIPAGGITTAATDGSARFYPAAKFLANSPTKLEYLGVSGSHTAGWTYQNDCVTITVGNLGFTQPNTNINYPMWGLGE